MLLPMVSLPPCENGVENETAGPSTRGRPFRVDAIRDYFRRLYFTGGSGALDESGVRELRRTPSTANARMIAVTGYGCEDDRRRTREAGFDAHLTKPADPSELQELLSVKG